MIHTDLFKTIRKQAGMTLIEIMVVVAIIGSIAALVTVNVLDFLDESKVETTKINVKNIEGALEQFRRRHGFYPSTEQGLSALVEKPSVGRVPDNYPSSGYLKKVPKDAWSTEFFYVSPGVHGNAYEVTSYGADGQEGGDEYDADINSWELDESSVK